MTIEEAVYSVLLERGHKQIRDYAERIVAEVSVVGERFGAASEGFRILGAYIFGGNEHGKSIAMTAPVVQTGWGSRESSKMSAATLVGNNRNWNVSFGMPRGSLLESLPKPVDDRVHLAKLPPARFAVAKFSGLAREKSIEWQTTQLNLFISGHQ